MNIKKVSISDLFLIVTKGKFRVQKCLYFLKTLKIRRRKFLYENFAVGRTAWDLKYCFKNYAIVHALCAISKEICPIWWPPWSPLTPGSNRRGPPQLPDNPYSRVLLKIEFYIRIDVHTGSFERLLRHLVFVFKTLLQSLSKWSIWNSKRWLKPKLNFHLNISLQM